MTIQEKRSQLVASNYVDLFQAIGSKIQALQKKIDDCTTFADIGECDMQGKTLIAEWKQDLKCFEDVEDIIPDDLQRVEAVIKTVQDLIETCGF